MLSRKTPPLVAVTTWSKDTSGHLGKEDCMMRSTMVILSKWMLFLDGDHLGKEDCMMRSTPEDRETLPSTGRSHQSKLLFEVYF